MKKKLLLLCLIPMVLSSCGTSGLTIEQMKEAIKDISIQEDLYPYYRVRGAIDYNNTYVQVDHEFTNDFRDKEYVAYARYNPGTYDENFDAVDEDKCLTFYNGTRSYWTRMPLRINPKNFHATLINPKGKEVINTSCTYYLLYNLMKVWDGNSIKNADAGGEMTMDIVKDDNGNFNGFTFTGLSLHSQITIDNYPMYADPEDTVHFPKGITYAKNGPCPMYKNIIDAKFNFRFVYNKDGWLEREYVATVNYLPGTSSKSQMCCDAVYTYSFNA